MKRFYLAAAVMTVAVSLASLSPVIAATANPAQSGQALEIAPPVITMTVNPGQVVNTQLSLRDIASGQLIVTGQANDFVAAGEDGTPKILLKGDGNDPYSLKKWVQPLPTLLLNPKQIKNLPITIKVPNNASPGGHYGVIRFTATPPELKGTGVSLSASLGALVLLTVRGDIKDSLSVAEFSVNKNGKTGHLFESTPINFVERIKNNGNVHETPRGQVVVKNMFGKTIGAVNINMSQRNILPDSIRKFSEPLDKGVLGTKRLFGRYTATMTLTYGSKKQTLTAKTSFWIIPYKLIAGIIIFLIGVFFGLRHVIRRHDEKVMRRLKSTSRYDKK
jgi:hypothetical protein